MKRTSLTAVMLMLPLLVSGCGNVHQGPSPALVRIIDLQATPGNLTTFGESLDSDVSVLIIRPADQGGNYFSFFPDIGRVTMDMVIKDPGVPGVTNIASDLNAVTFSRYRVQFIRSDGHNVEGVDVPYAFDSSVTFTVKGTPTSATFELVHHSAKAEAPLKALTTNGQFINTIARITFYGQDGGGNSVSVVGEIGVVFGDFADKSS